MYSFLGIGAQKAGTTWLYQQLARHPAVDFPGRRDHPFWDASANPGLPTPGLKEHHFWNWPSADDPDAVAAYLAQFDHPTRHQGDITPAYALLPIERIRQIRDLAPDLHLIYILRNPIERAWSAARMALGRAEMTLDEASDQWFIDHFRSRGSRARGDYLATINRWQAVFPPEQLLLLLHDDIATAPRTLLERLAVHLRLDPEPFRALAEDIVKRRVFGAERAPLRPSLRAVLQDIYHPQIQALSAHHGRPLPWT